MLSHTQPACLLTNHKQIHPPPACQPQEDPPASVTCVKEVLLWLPPANGPIIRSDREPLNVRRETTSSVYKKSCGSCQAIFLLFKPLNVRSVPVPEDSLWRRPPSAQPVIVKSCVSASPRGHSVSETGRLRESPGTGPPTCRYSRHRRQPAGDGRQLPYSCESFRCPERRREGWACSGWGQRRHFRPPRGVGDTLAQFPNRAVSTRAHTASICGFAGQGVALRTPSRKGDERIGTPAVCRKNVQTAT